MMTNAQRRNLHAELSAAIRLARSPIPVCRKAKPTQARRPKRTQADNRVAKGNPQPRPRRKATR